MAISGCERLAGRIVDVDDVPANVVAGILATCLRFGPEKDSPEGQRYIVISDTLAEEMTRWLRIGYINHIPSSPRTVNRADPRPTYLHLVAARLDAAKAVLAHVESLQQPLCPADSQTFKGSLQAAYDESLAYIAEQLRGAA